MKGESHHYFFLQLCCCCGIYFLQESLACFSWCICFLSQHFEAEKAPETTMGWLMVKYKTSVLRTMWYLAFFVMVHICLTKGQTTERLPSLLTRHQTTSGHTSMFSEYYVSDTNYMHCSADQGLPIIHSKDRFFYFTTSFYFDVIFLQYQVKHCKNEDVSEGSMDHLGHRKAFFRAHRKSPPLWKV